MRCIAVLGLILAFLTQQSSMSHAFCNEPNAPDPPGTFSKPDVPYCLSEFSYSGKHSCESYEIDSYKSEVEDYVRELKNYASEAESYYSDAVEYANCEIQDVVNQHE